jgi:serine/threonine protein kinase
VAAGRIGQQNIVDVSDFGRMADGRFYFAMEFLDGQTLAQELRNQGALPLRRAIHVLVQMSRALKAAHARGIVHRDLKPENVILLQREGQPDFVKVVDFGVAKVAAPGSSGMTSAGMVVGTPQYMSPEQAAGLPLDGRTDIYSLGLIAFELLSGRPPFTEATPSLMMAAHIHKPAPPLYDPGTVDGLPARLGVLVAQMLAKAPDQRPPSMQDVMAQLEEFADELPHSPPSGGRIRASSTPGVLPIPLVQEAPAPQRGGKGALIGVGLGVVILGAGAVGYALWGRSPPEAPPPPTQTPLAPIAQVPQAEVEIPAAPSAKGPIEPERVKLSLMSDPPNAEVYAGQTLLGRTPLMLDWNRGQRVELRFALDGYPPVERALEPAGDTPLFVKLVRTPVRSKKRSETNDDLKDNPFK